MRPASKILSNVISFKLPITLRSAKLLMGNSISELKYTTVMRVLGLLDLIALIYWEIPIYIMSFLEIYSYS